MRLIFLKIAEIRRGRDQFLKNRQYSSKNWYGSPKVGTVHQKIGAKIRFGHLRFFPLHRIFEHWIKQDAIHQRLLNP
jgi:hypothetical protein